MSLKQELEKRSNASCELCSAKEALFIYEIPPVSEVSADNSILICETCKSQIENPDTVNVNHWRCLNESMWSEHKPIQVLAWRMLNNLKNEGWPQDLLNMLYLDEEDLAWAKATIETENDEPVLIHKDVNGVPLEAGDSVVLIKDLKVKGSSMVAKQGNPVRRTSLDPDHEEYIEGKVDGQTIVIITKYVKKIG